MHAQKKEYLAKKAAVEKQKQLELEKSLEFAASEVPATESGAPIVCDKPAPPHPPV